MQIKLMLIVSFSLIAASNQAIAQEGKHLFILSGQSNMAGLKPEESFLPTVEAAFGKNKVIVVKDAMGTQPIRRWYKDWKPMQGDVPTAQPDLYDSLMKKVNSAVTSQRIASVTFIWMQGERDAREKLGNVYERSLLGLYQQLSAELLELTDWLIPNETEFRELHGSLPTSDDVLKSFRPGKSSIVTLGSEGAVYISPQGELHRVSAPKVTAVDTTGAGDSFLAGFLTGYALGITPGKVLLEIGARWASLMVTIDASIPPNFYEIEGIQEIIDKALQESK